MCIFHVDNIRHSMQIMTKYSPCRTHFSWQVSELGMSDRDYTVKYDMVFVVLY